MALNELSKTPSNPNSQPKTVTEAIDNLLYYFIDERSVTEGNIREMFPGLDCSFIIATALGEDLIYRHTAIKGGYGVYRITDNGVLIRERGGFSSVLKDRQQKRDESDFKQLLEIEKLQRDVIITKWQYRLFWMGSILAVLTFALQDYPLINPR